MATMIQNAAKGQRKAMELLYGANKQKAYFMAESLLLDSEQAAEAVNAAFKITWNSLSAAYITTEAEFTQLLLRKTAEACKKNISKLNSKAFRLPQNKNFFVTAEAGSVDPERCAEPASCPAAVPFCPSHCWRILRRSAGNVLQVRC